MALEYRIYGNGGAGGPVDYTTPLATVSGLTWTSPTLAAPSDWTFAVRARDSVSGLEEENVDARVRVLIDAGGVDRSNIPAAAQAVAAVPEPGGVVRVRWIHFQGAQPAATGFAVYANPGTSVNYALPPVATISGTFVAMSANLFAQVAGLADGVQHAIGVKATNPSGSSAPSPTVLVTPDATPPPPGTAINFTATPID